MAIKAIGTITANPGDGNAVDVQWDDEDAVPDEDWYFWTSRNTVWKVQPSTWSAKALVDFAFHGRDQDYAEFLSVPYWRKKYFGDTSLSPAPDDQESETRTEETPDESTYGVADIIAEGCFIPGVTLNGYLEALRRKKNLILQGPPGTGKTWLAKRLAYLPSSTSVMWCSRSSARVIGLPRALKREFTEPVGPVVHTDEVSAA